MTWLVAIVPLTQRILLSFLFISLVGFNCLDAQSFTDVAPSMGITTGFGANLFEGGGGISFVDWNGDGWDDLTLGTEAGRNVDFYTNISGILTPMETPPIDLDCESKAILWVDFDSDGDKDLLVTCYDQANRLYRNIGGSFIDYTEDAGLGLGVVGTYGATYGDFDKDGDLDLYICNYHNLPENPGGEVNEFYINNGDGTFTDGTLSTGTGNGQKQSFCATFFDYNNDGWEDLYLANDRLAFENALYKNNGDGTFTDVSSTTGTNINIFAMNSGIADYDENGHMDIYVTNIGESACFNNTGLGSFTNEANTNGTLFERIGWAGIFFDCDNDIDLDLYVCSQNVSFEQPNALYINSGAGIFSEPFFNNGGIQSMDTAQSYTAAVGDINNDGWLDIALNNAGDFPLYLFQNTSGFDNIEGQNWVKLQLVGTTSNPEAYGTKVIFYSNGVSYIRMKQSHNGYMTQHSDLLHQGMGSLTEWDSIKVIWPTENSVDILSGDYLTLNGVTTIVEGENPILPIQFLGISHESRAEGYTRIKWQITDAVNVSHFVISRKTNNSDFHPIGKLAYILNDQSISEYYYDDLFFNMQTEDFYYRVQALDYDGKITTSPIVHVRSDQINNTNFLLTPNIYSKGEIQLTGKIYGFDGQQLSICIIGSHGQQVYQSNFNGLDIGNDLRISIKDLSPGVYLSILESKNNSNILTRKFIVY